MVSRKGDELSIDIASTDDKVVDHCDSLQEDSAVELNDDFDPDVRKDDEGVDSDDYQGVDSDDYQGGDSDDYEGDDSDSDLDNDDEGGDSSDGSGLYICDDEESSDSEPKEWNEVEGTESDSDVPNYDSDISSDSGIIDFENDQQREEYIIYKRQFRHSEGFDITDLPSFGFVGMITPVDFDYPGYFLNGCRKGLDLAINRYNERQNADLELIKILKSNKVAHTIYFTTFEAKSKTDKEGDAKTYQAKMFYDDISGKFLSYKFRLKKQLIQLPEKVKSMQD
ncbi:uncharacterized protein LOC126660030 isoform X2 [Mercurialis annua]|uniref:uncharacterized protein LOC126660030 isoform X2 n=1 Tax=Mercurialis annua TaxID=3986 RepID=UPI00215EDF1A|nr:uncharacterized protein LOC126660030 isoform X2 [Mercurialis annua]